MMIYKRVSGPAVLSDFLPSTPHHGSWHASCSPGTQRCQLALQPHPAHAAVYGTCSDEYWPVPPTEFNKNNTLKAQEK